MKRYRVLILGGWLTGLLPASAGPLSPEQTARVEACLTEARAQAAPVYLLQQRWEEGVAKNVDPEQVVQAVQHRWQLMQRSREMVVSSGYMPEAPPVVDLQASLTLALESGLEAETLTSLLAKGGGQYAGRMEGVVEAGEALHLAGLDDQTVRNLMEDGLARNLRRVEMLRVVRYAVQQHRDGASGEQIRGSLWGPSSNWQDPGAGAGGAAGAGIPYAVLPAARGGGAGAAAAAG